MLYEGDLKRLINRKIVNVEQSQDGVNFFIEFEDGKEKFYVDADCCSESWIEHLEVPNDINGATLLSVHEADMIDGGSDIAGNRGEQECLSVYETRFCTNKGDIVLEYRNSSNGYYGGSLVLCKK